MISFRKDVLPPFIDRMFSVSKDVPTETTDPRRGIFDQAEYLKLLSTPNWINLNNLYNVFMNNPVLYATLSINAKYFSSVDVRVRNIKTGEVYSKQNMREGKITDAIAKKMFDLIAMPNPLQSTVEFLTMNSLTYDLYGNSFIRGNFALDRYDIQQVATLNNLWPQYVNPKMTGKFLNALTIKEIIEKWDYSLYQGGNFKGFKPDEVLHRKEANLSYNTPEDIVLGKSRVIPLQMPLSNIIVAYESRNVIGKERGMRAVISPDNKDPLLGSLSMTPTEKKNAEDTFKKKYGLLEGQNQFMISEIPIKIDQLDQDIRKLGILEEIGMDAMIIAHVFNVPIELIKMFLQGATYENQGASDRRMYQTNAIPKAADFFDDLNNWLQTRKFGFEYVPDWSHIAVLKEDHKEQSLIDRNESFVCREAFLAGMINYNQWLKRLGWEEVNEPWAKKRITEMTDKEIQVISGRNLMQAQNANPQTPNSSSQI